MSPTSAAPPPPAPAVAEPLLRVIGTFGLAAAIINITVGGGIFRLPANATMEDLLLRKKLTSTP